jgi:collagenase-like PrtC family protease
MLNGKLLSVGSNGNSLEMDKILAEFSANISSMYFPIPSNICGNGRSRNRVSSIEETINHIKLSHKYGVASYALMNSTTEGGHELTHTFEQQIRETLNTLMDAGLNGLVTNHPLICSWVDVLRRQKGYDFTIKIGLWSEVSYPRDVEVFSNFGADAFSVNFDLNRNFPMLEALRLCTPKKLILLANNGCIYRCPYRFFHRSLQSLYSRMSREEQQGIRSQFSYFELCGDYLKSHPLDLIKTPFIRPEDVSIYLDMGFDEIKLSTRNHPYYVMRDVIKCYVEERYEGDICKLLFKHIKNEKSFDNRLFDGIIGRIKKEPENEQELLEHYLLQNGIQP